ncbi:hypothetical protein [Actinomadura rugatobispora]|uniref:Uncharacterized protein n=1 Tax=Actinomadura rugatobispora TaxID=1994 RepID=A0ABW1A5I9_9ACTN|nr:hypothetical protein GCM10010200_017820 [Actinomadura rugatobispora]
MAETPGKCRDVMHTSAAPADAAAGAGQAARLDEDKFVDAHVVVVLDGGADGVGDLTGGGEAADGDVAVAVGDHDQVLGVPVGDGSTGNPLRRSKRPAP